MSSIIKYNKSKTYLLPLLSELIGFEMQFMKHLINTYMFVEPSEDKLCLAILHDFSYQHPEFTRYEHSLTSSDLFVRSYDIDNQVLYVFRFPDEYLPEYNALYHGRYSEFGKDAKELILSFWSDIHSQNRKAIDTLIKVKQILYKDEKLRLSLQESLKVEIPEGSELGSKIEVEDETFKLN